jgi:thiol-disulfide isomerase/thioredoxin
MKRLLMLIVLVSIAQFSFPAHAAVKKLVFEDLTGAWCGYCPRGPIEMEALKAVYPNNVIIITQHNGDKMENSFSMILCDKASGFPNMMVNRRKVEGVTHSTVFAYENEIKNTPATVAVGIQHAWNNSTRAVTGTITAKFEQAPTAGDLRIGLMIVENNVVGSGTDYDQSNYYNTTSEYPELKGAGNPIIGYKHLKVQRDCPLSGVYGKSGIIPSSPVVGTDYSTAFTYTVPAQYNSLNVILENVSLVAFVGYNEGAILNAEEVLLVNKTPVINRCLLNGCSSGKSVTRISNHSVLNAKNARISIHDLSGREIVKTRSTAETYTLAAFRLPRGCYILKVGTEKQALTELISITR